MPLKRIRNIIVAIQILIFPCYAAEVVLLDVASERSDLSYRLDLSCQFYGLELQCFMVGENEDKHSFVDIVKQKSLQAIVITSRAIGTLKAELLIPAFKREEGKNIPLMIIEVTPETNMELLQEWSGGAITKCASFNKVPFSGFYKVSDLKIIARQLAGQKIPFSCKRLNYFSYDKMKSIQSIVQVSNSTNENLVPIFIKTVVEGKEVFFLTQNQLAKSTALLGKKYNSGSELYSKMSRQLEDNILQILPLMMFLRYACGERGWHSKRNYSNFTIDDPWLTEPYGHLSYKGLLKQMEKSDFHTTIAFIPWNYDRSKPDVVSLFLDNAERFSICIHGNDHDHQEFYKYEKKSGDLQQAKSLRIQEANVRQALARMAKFRVLTGLSYDKVMVFPHGIAPAKSLGLLKKYNFLATVNVSNVPIGSDEPEYALFRLRPMTMRFENFPSLNRYWARRAKFDIAIDLFLDNPLLFYAHHDFFQDGIDAFNGTADMINSIQPDIIWQSLGYICQHLYLEKLRDDGHYDVLSFSSNFILENNHQHDVTYYLRKEESFSFPIKQVTADGRPYPYRKSGSDLMLDVFVPVGESRHIVIEYENELDLSFIDISKNDPRVNRLRRLSDFRDMSLSMNVFGRTFTRVYYDSGLYKFGLMRLAIVSLILSILMTTGTLYLIKRKKRQKKSKIQ